MSFWEEFGQRITQESQKAIQKTRDIASVVTMNADISDSKRKISELYRELGELLISEAFAGTTAAQLRAALDAKSAGEGADSASAAGNAAGTAGSADHEIVLRNWRDIYEKVMYIRSEEEVIAINEAKIDELKAESRCPRCGRIVTKGMSFCPECGAKLPEQEAPAGGETPAAGGAAAAADGAASPDHTSEGEKAAE